MTTAQALPDPVLPPEHVDDNGVRVPWSLDLWEIREHVDERDSWIPPPGARVRKFGALSAPSYCG